MASGSVVVSKCVKALKGTALLKAELVAPAEVEPWLEADVTVLDVSAFTGGTSVFADGVKSGEVVIALEPADEEPLAPEEAAAPLVPAAEFD
jgi:hypothetical protein